MKAVVLKIDSRKSRMGGKFHYIFVRSLDQDTPGKSFRGSVSENFRNFNRWRGVRVGDILDLLNIIRHRNGEVIDGDSQFSVVGEDPVVKQTRPGGKIE